MAKRNGCILLVILTVVGNSSVVGASLAQPATSAASSAHATESKSREWLLDYHADLKKKLDKKAYDHLEPSDREQIRKAQAGLHALLDDKPSIKSLSADEKTQVWNLHEQVQAILESREGQRMVCERVRVIGTNLPTTRCLTVAERERRRQEAADMVRDNRVFVDTPRNN